MDRNDGSAEVRCFAEGWSARRCTCRHFKPTWKLVFTYRDPPSRVILHDGSGYHFPQVQLSYRRSTLPVSPMLLTRFPVARDTRLLCTPKPLLPRDPLRWMSALNPPTPDVDILCHHELEHIV